MGSKMKIALFTIPGLLAMLILISPKVAMAARNFNEGEVVKETNEAGDARLVDDFQITDIVSIVPDIVYRIIRVIPGIGNLPRGGGIPGINGGIPGFNGGVPGFNGGIPGFNGGVPGFNGGIGGGFPGISGGIPAVNGGIPGINGGIPRYGGFFGGGYQGLGGYRGGP